VTEKAFRNFCWGFLFVMVDFRLNGLDILPDIAGYLFFAAGLNVLADRNFYFNKARLYNIIMVIVSIFFIYQKPVQNTLGINIHFDPLGLVIGLTGLIFIFLFFYHLFMAIKDLADEAGESSIAGEAQQRWKQFVYFQLAVYAAILLIFLPFLAIVYVIAMLVVSIMLTLQFMGFMTRCGEYFSGE
jgi:uncharacterized membrane protein YhaH (DUF805 family)